MGAAFEEGRGEEFGKEGGGQTRKARGFSEDKFTRSNEPSRENMA